MVVNIDGWTGFVILVVNVVVGGFIYRYGSYMKKKGDNQATKDDIGKITHIVEEAKKQHTNEIESLKSNLDVSAQRRKIIFEDGKKALYEFYSLINNWFLYGRKSNYDAIYDSNDYTFADEVEVDVIEFAKKVYVQKNMIELLVIDKELIKAVVDVYEAYMHHYNSIRRHMSTLRNILLEIQEYVEEQHNPSGDPKYKDLGVLYGELVNVTAPQRIGECRKEERDYTTHLKTAFESFKQNASSYFHS